MGGFMINGIGAADSFYLLKPLPGHLCRSCGKKDYALMEVKRKVRILYIPTVSLNTKYAVACPKCKNGYYISEEQKSYILLNDPSCVEVGSDGVITHGITEQSTTDKPEEDYVTIDEDDLAQKNLCQCGAELPLNAIFCLKCGRKVSNDDPMLPKDAEQKVSLRLPEEEIVMDEPKNNFWVQDTDPIPHLQTCRCGAVMSASAKYCNRCGAKLSENSNSAADTDAENTKPLYILSDLQNHNSIQTDKNKGIYNKGKKCPECGMRALPGRETCGICGTKLE